MLCKAIVFGGKIQVIELFQDFDEYLATPYNFPTLLLRRAFESSSWDKLNGGHVSIVKVRKSKNTKKIKSTENTKKAKKKINIDH